MKLLMISAFAAISLLAAATTILRSHSRSADHLVGMPSLQEFQSATDVNKLPVEEFEDQSLVYSNKTKH
jgi:hypothetical protein